VINITRKEKFYSSKNVGVIGAGYVGLVVAGFLSSKGHNVGVYDIDKTKLDMLKNKKFYIHEKGLDKLFEKVKVYDTLEELVEYKNIFFVTIGTPSKTNGDIELSYLDRAAVEIGRGISKKKNTLYPTYVVLKSTVPPTYVSKFAYKIKNYAGKNVEVIYNPEFLSEGMAVYNVTYPDKIVIGTKNGELPLDIMELYEKAYTDFSDRLFLTNWENAAMIKYANNAFLSTKISYINQIADICEIVPNCDVNVVAKALGYDDRISPRFLRAGLGYGGSCFTKDLAAISLFATNNKIETPLLEAVTRVNKDRRVIPVKIAENLWNNPEKHKIIAILGISFKPGTDDIRDSPAISIIQYLRSILKNITIQIYDPEANNEAVRNVFRKDFSRVIRCPSAKFALKGADMAVICTDWDEFKSLESDDFMLLMNEPVVIDGRRILDPEKLIKDGIKYYGIGYGNNAINRKEIS